MSWWGAGRGVLGLVILVCIALASAAAVIAGLVIAWMGLEHAFGLWWALAAFIVAMLFRFSPPLMVGVFFCARDLWGWHWAAALLVALPGLVLLVPGVLIAAAAPLLRWRRD